MIQVLSLIQSGLGYEHESCSLQYSQMILGENFMGSFKY
jgi:hypothetical protein